MDEINLDYEEYGSFIRATASGAGNWYRPEVEETPYQDYAAFLSDLAAEKPRAQAYLAEIIAWRMNREQP